MHQKLWSRPSLQWSITFCSQTFGTWWQPVRGESSASIFWCFYWCLCSAGCHSSSGFLWIWRSDWESVCSCLRLATSCSSTAQIFTASMCHMWLTWCTKKPLLSSSCKSAPAQTAHLQLLITHLQAFIFSFWRQHNREFLHTLRKLESDPMCQRQTLKSFLVLPFQRITRVKLLLEVWWDLNCMFLNVYQCAECGVSFIQSILKQTEPDTEVVSNLEKAIKALHEVTVCNLANIMM